jgi:hypothetical protein
MSRIPFVQALCSTAEHRRNEGGVPKTESGRR